MENNMKKVLEDVKQEIEDSLSTINNKIDELRQSAPPGEGKDIFHLNFIEYEKISIIKEILKKTQKLGDQLLDLNKEIKSQHIYTNFRIINQSVKVLEHSKEYPTHPLDIMLGKKSNVEYSLFDGNSNHFIVVDLGEFVFLKNIKISVDNIMIPKEFTINKETQFVKIEFIDNWGVQNGNFILIKVLCFEIGDIL